jgi:cell wall assembly regulator SMI1
MHLGPFNPQSFYPPATEAAIREAEASLGCALPADYCAFLAISNGYDDVLGSGYLSLWPVEQLAANHEGYEVSGQLADAVLIGSNGGGTAYGILSEHGQPFYISVPFIPMQRGEVRLVGASLAEFVAAIARGDGW